MRFLTENWRGLTVLGLGVATILAGIFVLDSCADAGHFVKSASGMDMHMACTWTERAVLGIGGLVAAMGLVMLFYREASRAISLIAGAGGALMIATPLWLIPTCKNAMMTCNHSLKIGALILGAVIAVVGLIGAIRVTRASGAGFSA